MRENRPIVRALSLALATSVASLLVAVAAQAETFVVNSVADGPASGGCGGVGAGPCTLRDAVVASREANSPGADRISFAPSLSGRTITLSEGQLTNPPHPVSGLGGRLTIEGPGAGQLTVDADGASRVITGTANGEGGFSGPLRISGLTLTGGAASFGGAIHWFSGADLEIADSVIVGNNATSNDASAGGGAIWFITGSGLDLTISDTVIADNDSQSRGGAIHALGDTFGGSIGITNSTFTGNTADTGGAIRIFGGVEHLTIANSTISGNKSRNSNSALSLNARTTLNNATVTANTSDSDGNGSGSGGVGISSTGSLVIYNTVIAGNTTNNPAGFPDCQGTVAQAIHSLIGDHSGCSITSNNAGLPPGTDPRLGPLAENGGPTPTHALLAGSPLIGAGFRSAPGGPIPACRERDQRGVLRTDCDIGAFERDAQVAIRIKGKRVPLRRRSLVVTLACPAAEQAGPCRGRVVVKTGQRVPFGGKRRRVKLAAASYEIPAGRTKRVRAALTGNSRQVRRKLRLQRTSPRARRVKTSVRVRDSLDNRGQAMKRQRVAVR